MWYADEKGWTMTATQCSGHAGRANTFDCAKQKTDRGDYFMPSKKTKWNNSPLVRVEMARKDGGIRHFKSLSIRLSFVDNFVGRFV